MLRLIEDINIGDYCYIQIIWREQLAYKTVEPVKIVGTCTATDGYLVGVYIRGALIWLPEDTPVLPYNKHTTSLTIDELLELFEDEEINIKYPEGKKEEAVDPDKCIHEFIDMFNSRACRFCGIDEKEVEEK